MSVKKNSNQTEVKQEQSALDHEYQLDHQIVKGVFRNLSQKNSPLRFAWRKYKQDPIRFYPSNNPKEFFIDGRTYEVPLMIANYLNNKCYREVSSIQLPGTGAYGAQHELGAERVEVTEKKHRFMFVSTDFKPVKGWQEPQQQILMVNKPNI